MKKHVKYIIWGALIVGGIGIIGLLGYLKQVNDYKKAVSEIVYNQIDLKSIPDGSYEGTYDVDFVKAKVAVEMKDGVIEEIEILEHINERGEGANSITDEIVKQQKIDVDTVSGATNSSKVIKKAVEDALLNQ